MGKLDQIAQDTQILRERLVEKVPGHFGMSHIIAAFLGSLFFGFAFVLKGLLFQVGLLLTESDLILITLATWIILTLEIYFVGYRRVPDKFKRPFGQFWFKRMVSYYGIALFTSFMLLTLYGIPHIAVTQFNLLKLIVAVSFPAAIGAAAADLLSKY